MSDPIDDIDKALKTIVDKREEDWWIPWFAEYDENGIPDIMVKGTEMKLRKDVWLNFVSNTYLKKES